MKKQCIPVGCVPSAAVPICWAAGWVYLGGGSAQGRCQSRGGICLGVSAWGCLPRGCLSREGVCPGGSLPGAVSAQGGVGPGGSAQWGVYPSMHWGRLPLWMEWLTDACKKITFLNFVADGNYDLKYQPCLCQHQSILNLSNGHWLPPKTTQTSSTMKYQQPVMNLEDRSCINSLIILNTLQELQ